MAVGLVSEARRQWDTPTGAWCIAVLDKHQANDWRYVPVLCARLRSFCQRYDSDADGHVLTEAYQTHFLSDTPRMLGIVMIEADHLQAHLLVSIDQWMGCTVCTVLQYEHDAQATPIPHATLQAIFAWVGQWARQHNAVRMQCLVREKRLVKTFAACYGFSPYALIMTQALPGKDAL